MYSTLSFVGLMQMRATLDLKTGICATWGSIHLNPSIQSGPHWYYNISILSSMQKCIPLSWAVCVPLSI